MTLRLSPAAFRGYRAMRGAVNADQAHREINRAQPVRRNADGSELYRLPRDICGERLRLYARGGEVFRVKRESDLGEPGKGRRSQKRHETRRMARHLTKLMQARQTNGLPRAFREELDAAVRGLERQQVEVERRFAEAIRLVRSVGIAIEHGDNDEASRLLTEAADIEFDLTGESEAISDELFDRLGLDDIEEP